MGTEVKLMGCCEARSKRPGCCQGCGISVKAQGDGWGAGGWQGWVVVVGGDSLFLQGQPLEVRLFLGTWKPPPFPRLEIPSRNKNPLRVSAVPGLAAGRVTSEGRDSNACSSAHLLCVTQVNYVTSPLLTFAEWLSLCPACANCFTYAILCSKQFC